MKAVTEKIPELRFPEFDGEWSEERLGDISERISSGRSDTKSSSGGFLVYGSTGVIGCTDSPEYSGESVLVARVGANAGSLYKVEGHYGVSDNTLILKTLDGSCFEWIYYFLKKENLNRLVFGSGQPLITGRQLKNLKIRFPDFYEQKKIASFLSSIDRRIEGLEKKRELLKGYKKGLMQKLFNQSLRFGNGTNPFPKWEQRSFASLYDFESTNSYSRDMLNYEVGTVKNVHYGDIHTKFKSQFSIAKEKVPFIDPSIDLSPVRKGQYLQEGDLIIADASEDYADIGKSIEVVDLSGAKAVAGLHTILARRKSADEMAIGFAAYLMQSENVKLSIMRVAQGTKVLGLSPTRFGAIEVKIPHPDEQKKITDCLSALDRKIEQVETQVLQTQDFKQGLLQKMFV